MAEPAAGFQTGAQHSAAMWLICLVNVKFAADVGSRTVSTLDCCLGIGHRCEPLLHQKRTRERVRRMVRVLAPHLAWFKDSGFHGGWRFSIPDQAAFRRQATEH